MQENAHGRHPECRRPSLGGDTVTFVTMSAPVTAVKRAIFRQLSCTSPFHVVVGFDAAQCRLCAHSVRSMVRNVTAETQSRAQLVPMSDAALKQRFSEKIHNFAAGFSGGDTRGDSPAKLAAIDWFVRSPFAFMWSLEDDAWSHDFGAMTHAYTNSTADFVARVSQDALPFWFDSGWMVGSRAHGLPRGTVNFAGLAAYRISGLFAQAVVDTIRQEPTTSHHEIYLPFVLSRHPSLTVEPLRERHQVELSFGQVAAHPPLCKLQHRQLFHPVKSECGELEAYHLPHNRPCPGCPHPQREVDTWQACRSLCDSFNAHTPDSGHPCTGWVYNDWRQCYLKQGEPRFQKVEEEWLTTGGATTYAGLPSHSQRQSRLNKDARLRRSRLS